MQSGEKIMAKTATIDPAREAYQQRMQAQIDLWKSEISRLKAKLLLMDANNRINGQRQLQEIERSYDNIVKDFERLTQASASRWEDIKLTVSAAAEQVKREIEIVRRDVEQFVK
jgi:hypothetical protein